MKQALEIARHARGEVPVGALILNQQYVVVATALNTRERDLDISGHAEINAIRYLMRGETQRNLSGLTLVTTLEPCPMCAFAIRESRVSRVVFGSSDPLYGAAGSRYDILRDARLGPTVEVVGGILEDESARLIKEYFLSLRMNESKTIRSTSTYG
jgi:tRNA(adenine34) deaminase